MKLLELDPCFIRYEGGTPERYVKTGRETANGIRFLCPVCFKKHQGPVGTHSIICWDPSVPRKVSPGPGRWEMKGEGFEDLTLVAKSSSIKLTNGCQAHFFVRNGHIVET